MNTSSIPSDYTTCPKNSQLIIHKFLFNALKGGYCLSKVDKSIEVMQKRKFEKKEDNCDIA